MKTLKFRAPLFTIKEIDGLPDDRKCIGTFPVRGFWGDTIAVQREDIAKGIEKYHPGYEWYQEGRYAEVDSEGHYTDSPEIYIEGSENDNEWDDIEFSMNSLEIQQFTGCKDSKGLDIYEGDICDFRGTIGVWKWDDFQWKVLNKDGRWMPIINLITPIVIGNIHEHPELISH